MGEHDFATERATWGSIAIVSVRGEIDMLTASQLREALGAAIDERTSDHLVLDLTHVTFLSSGGLALLVETHDLATARSMTLRIVSGRPGWWSVRSTSPDSPSWCRCTPISSPRSTRSSRLRITDPDPFYVRTAAMRGSPYSMGVVHGDRVFTLAARATSARVARTRARAWLEEVAWPSRSIDDIVYAINEAISNAIEHAYAPSEPAGTVELRLRIAYDMHGFRQVRTEVRDHGRWRTPPPDDHGRRRGLTLINALMDEVTVHPIGPDGLQGTSVVMLSSPAPAVPRIDHDPPRLLVRGPEA